MVGLLQTVGNEAPSYAPSPSVDVRAYGAKGDGITDDSAAIQAALNSNPTVLIPNAVFLCLTAIMLRSGVTLCGQGPNSVLKAGTNLQRVINGSNADGWAVRDLAIDGGGQTTDIYHGVRGVVGIIATNAKYFTIERVQVSKCGIMNSVSPTNDAGYAGLGIDLNASGGECAYGVVRQCRVFNIAGGGNSSGDGIYIAGYNASSLITAHDILVEDCLVSYVGRHAYTVAGTLITSLPSDITIRKCAALYTALSGLDVEDGKNLLLDDCNFHSCGNDQTYYDPATAYGVSFNLLSGLSTGNDSDDITVEDCNFVACYFGIKYGAGANFLATGCRFKSGTFEDMSLGLAQSPSSMRVTNCELLSTGADMTLVYRSAQTPGPIVFTGCTFAKKAKLSQSWDVTFRGCVFRAGFLFASASILRPSLIDCLWADYAGPAISWGNISYGTTDLLMLGCRFAGAGNLTRGLDIQYVDLVRARVIGCVFVGLTGAGIFHSNANGAKVFACITDNEFLNCAAGIDITQAIINGVIAGNTFDGITGYCISISGITSGVDMVDVVIANNVAGAGVTNGLRVAVTTGTWDRTILTGNNMHNASGTKWTLAAGNAGGVVSGNIMT